MKAIKFTLSNFEEILAAPFMVIMSVMVTVQVVCRFILHFNTPWAEEFLRYCFIWNIMLGASIGIKLKAHIGVNLLVENLPRLPRLATETVAFAAVLFICGMFFQASWAVMMLQKNAGQIMPGLKIPMFLSTLALPVGFALIIIRTLGKLIDLWKAFLAAPGKKEA